MSDKEIEQTEEEMVEVSEDGNSASNMSTIAAKPTGISRSDLIAKMVNYASQMSKETLAQAVETISKTPDEVYSTIAAAANATGNNAEKNRGTIKSSGKHIDPMPTVKEDLAILFGDSDDLSEDFRERTEALFEAAVSARIAMERTKIEEAFEVEQESFYNEMTEAYEVTLAESVEEIKAEMVENIDTYLNYAVAEWISENKLAIESGLKTQVAESFMAGLKNVFQEHYVNIPDDQVDVVEAMASELEEVKAAFAEVAEENAKLFKIVSENEIYDITATFSEGMTDTQKDKFYKLTEAVNYSDVEEFRKKVTIIKETYFPRNTEVKVAAEDQLLSESVEDEPTTKTSSIDPSMQAYVSSITRTLKR